MRALCTLLLMCLLTLAASSTAQARYHHQYHRIRVAPAPARCTTGADLWLRPEPCYAARRAPTGTVRGLARANSRPTRYTVRAGRSRASSALARRAAYRAARLNRGPSPSPAPQNALEPLSGPLKAAQNGVETAVREVHQALHGGASVSGLPGPLVAKIQEIESSCPGFYVGSAFRPGARVAGSGHMSLHASHRAADIMGPNFGCAYSHLQGWQGGMSLDANLIIPHHIHISWNPGGRQEGHFYHAAGVTFLPGHPYYGRGGGGHRYYARARGNHYYVRAHSHRYRHYARYAMRR